VPPRRQQRWRWRWRWPWPGRAAQVRSPPFGSRSAWTYPRAAGVVRNSAVSRRGSMAELLNARKACLAPTTAARQDYTGAARRSPLADDVTEGPGGGRVRVLQDRHGTRRRGAAAPVVSAHARACELRHSLTPANEPYAEVRTRSSARLLLR
jgi:hypothetical protein